MAVTSVYTHHVFMIELSACITICLSRSAWRWFVCTDDSSIN